MQLNKSEIEKIAKEAHIQALSEGKSIYLRAVGSSMYPYIKSGDIITVSPLNSEKISLGDILAVDNQGNSQGWFCVHRLVLIAEQAGAKIYSTKGDNNLLKSDNPVEFKQIFGKVVRIQRQNIILDFTKKRWGLINRSIAFFSYRCPKMLKFISFPMAQIIEFKLLPEKIGRIFFGSHL